ncbi:hypothetical protein RXX31_03860 [Vibrio sp. EA2]|nr:hypothetical protein [Vibrio sp. EA2]MDV6250419.1 hypothetical protein [Vibrio sp. EA2]
MPENEVQNGLASTRLEPLSVRNLHEFPLYNEDTFKCGTDNSCIGCPKKLMELVDSELSYWQHQLNRGISPTFDEIYSFGKMCKNVRRALVRNKRI